MPALVQTGGQWRSLSRRSRVGGEGGICSCVVASVLFLVAYTCSGLAGLVYEVTWTRMLTLFIGHTTAAASTVVAAFLGGLALGAALGGRAASRMTPKRCLHVYVALEASVVVCALLLPLELTWFRPLLQSAYHDGTGAMFPWIRIASSLVMVMLPACALGATYPMAVRWFARNSNEPATPGSMLYFMNTVGAAVGSMLAGFVLIPSIGMTATIDVAMAATTIAALSVLAVSRISSGEPFDPFDSRNADEVRIPLAQGALARAHSHAPPWLAIVILGLSGFAALVHEIAWTRILSLVLGPTTYAFAATLAAVIAGVAIGSGIGTWLVSTRASKAAGMLAFALLLAALTAGWSYSVAGTRVPAMVAHYVADLADFDQLLKRGVLLTMGLIVPTSACLGAAFPLALSLADDHRHAAAGRFGLVYAVNTIGSVAGSLAAGFWFIPAFGLQPTLWIVSGCLVLATLVLIGAGALTGLSRVVGVAVSAGAVLLLVLSPPWDRELLASGVYMYAPYVPKDLDLETQLKAGELLYYAEGAAATVSVKKLTGTTTLAVDGKTDASNRGDMLTQKLIAHLPLLLHKDPKNVFIIGLGSGMTAGAALTHPITRADVIEISPEVVKASDFFKVENRNALADPRLNLIIGDGRSYLALSEKKYDAIISEPSNPWIAGVASLFTREFFESARARLAPGGVICQWVNAYNINQADLKSVIATFASVFPEAKVYLVGRDDVLLLAMRDDPSNASVERVSPHMQRKEVAEDLASVGVTEPFSITSLWIADTRELQQIHFLDGAHIFTDDRLTLEFTAPRELHSTEAGRNGAELRRHRTMETVPVTAEGLIDRATMLAKADHYQQAYDDFITAASLDPLNVRALRGVVDTSAILNNASDAFDRLNQTGGNQTSGERLVTLSKLLAAQGRKDEALAKAEEAAAIDKAAGTEQRASIYADAGDSLRLDAAVADLRQIAPARASTEFFAAVAAFLHGDAVTSVDLAQRAIDLDPNYAATYDLIGAAFTKAGKLGDARMAFEKSLTFNAHDSTAYENLGVLELNAGNKAVAAKYFAEALWLVPDSQTAREGLAQSRR